MATVAAGFIRRTETDHRFTAYQRRFCANRFRGFNCNKNGIGIMSVNFNDMPAVGFKTLWRIVFEPAIDMTIDRNSIIIPEGDKLTQTQGTRQRAGLVGNTLHETAIPHKRIGVMVDNIMLVSVIFRCQRTLGNRHTDRIGNSLAKRAGGSLDSRRIAMFRMARRF